MYIYIHLKVNNEREWGWERYKETGPIASNFIMAETVSMPSILEIWKILRWICFINVSFPVLKTCLNVTQFKNKQNKLGLTRVKNNKLWISIYLNFIHCQLFIKNPVCTMYSANWYMPYDIYCVIYLPTVKFSHLEQCDCDFTERYTITSIVILLSLPVWKIFLASP